jgi:hypothetical protein
MSAWCDHRAPWLVVVRGRDPEQCLRRRRRRHLLRALPEPDRLLAVVHVDALNAGWPTHMYCSTQ